MAALPGQGAAVVGDGDLLRLSGPLVVGRDLQDSVLVHIEGHLDLGDPTGRWNQGTREGQKFRNLCVNKTLRCFACFLEYEIGTNITSL